MTKVKLLIKDIYQLDGELKGLTNSQTGEVVMTGLLQQKLPIVPKYWLNDLSKKTTELKVIVDELRNELIKKYGVLNEDVKTFTVPVDKIESFQTELAELFNEEKELEVYEFKLSMFESIETTDNYQIFYNLVSPE